MKTWLVFYADLPSSRGNLHREKKDWEKTKTIPNLNSLESAFENKILQSHWLFGRLTHLHTDTLTFYNTNIWPQGQNDTQTHRNNNTLTQQHTYTLTHQHTNTSAHWQIDTDTLTLKFWHTETLSHFDTLTHWHIVTLPHLHIDTITQTL